MQMINQLLHIELNTVKKINVIKLLNNLFNKILFSNQFNQFLNIFLK